MIEVQSDSGVSTARQEIPNSRAAFRFLEKVGRAGFVVASGLLVTRLASFIISTLIARKAGAEIFGQFTLFLSIFTLVSEIPNALDTTFIRFANKPDEKLPPSTWLALAVFGKLLYAILIGLVSWVGSGYIATWFNVSDAEGLIRTAVWTGVSATFFYTLQAAYQQRYRFGIHALLRPLPWIVILMLLVSMGLIELAGKQGKVDAILHLYLEVMLVSAASGLVILLFKMMPGLRQLRKGMVAYLKHAGILVSSTFINLCLAQMDVFFVTSYLNFQELGNYGVALRLQGLLGVALTVMVIILTPIAPSIVDRKGVRKYFLTALILILPVMVVCAIIISFMEQIISMLFGDGYTVVTLIASLLIIKIFMNVCAAPFQVLLQCSHVPWIFLMIVLIRLSLTVTGLSYFVPLFGSLGAAMVAVAVATTTAFILAGAAWCYSIGPSLKSG